MTITITARDIVMHRPMLAAPSRVRRVLSCLLLATASACASGGGRTSFVPPSRPAQFSLAGVPWGIRADSVTSLIEPRGYNFNRVDRDGDLWYDGVLYQSPTRIFAFMGNERLVKMRVLIGSPDEDALSVYESARAELVKQYGAPSETVERFQAPYRKGDGKELEAVRAGKAVIGAHWLPGEGGRTSHIAVHVSNQLNVVVDYEGPAWERESLRRRKAN